VIKVASGFDSSTLSPQNRRRLLNNIAKSPLTLIVTEVSLMTDRHIIVVLLGARETNLDWLSISNADI
jgi:hypothetical protein